MNTTQSIISNPNPSALAVALHGANVESILKASELKVDTKPAQNAMNTVIIRSDVKGASVVFFPETYSKEENRISYWSGEKHAQIHDTNADYYFTSKPASEEAVKEMASKYAERFKIKELVVRQRLIKNSGKIDRNNEGQATTIDVQGFKERLIAALVKAINETL